MTATIADINIQSPGPMIGFDFGRKVFESGSCSGVMFSEVSPSEAEEFWDLHGKKESDWLEFRTHLDDDSTSLIVNARLGELFPVWHYESTLTKPKPAIGGLATFAPRLLREAWEFSISDEMIRISHEREYEPSQADSSQLESEVIRKKWMQWAWSTLCELLRIIFDGVRTWILFSNR